jgi:hypothetical protein
VHGFGTAHKETILGEIISTSLVMLSEALQRNAKHEARLSKVQLLIHCDRLVGFRRVPM